MELKKLSNAGTNRPTMYMSPYQYKCIADAVEAKIRHVLEKRWYLDPKYQQPCNAEHLTRTIVERLERIEKLISEPRPQNAISISEAMQMTGHRSRSAFYQWAKGMKLKTCTAGHYLPDQVQHAMRLAAFRKLSK